MKNLKKKIVALLLAVVTDSAMTVGASAAYVSYGSSCPGNSSSSNSYSGSVNGSADANSILEYFDANGTTGGNSVYDAIESYINAATQNQSGNTQNCGGSTCTTSTNSACPASDGSACPETNGGSCAASSGGSCFATDGSACLTSNAAAQASTPASTTAPKANTSETTATTTNSAAETEAAAEAETDTETADTPIVPAGLISCTGTTVDEGTLTKLLNNILSECGSYLSKFGIELPASGPAVAVTPEPTANGGTDQTAAPQPTDNGAAQTDTSADNLSFEQQVAALVNEQRAANGLAPLTLTSELSNVARIKSQDMSDNNYFSHTSPTYGSPFDMMKSFGISYRTAGENIAMGYATPEAVMNAWMNSPGHKANILNASYTQIGVGYSADGNYWTQEFIG